MTDVYENKLTKAQIEELAAHCEKAELEAYEITKITDDYPQMTYKDAFDIQWVLRSPVTGFWQIISACRKVVKSSTMS